MDRLTIAGVTEVIIDSGLPRTLLPVREGRERVAVLTQPAATNRALEAASSLKGAGLMVEVIGLPDREEAKTLQTASSVYEALNRFGLGRHDTIVGVGGGALTDVAGFVAGTWLRGVESVYLPTTLVGAVDAAVGGKTGVNAGGKNLVGVFWHPSRVVIDVQQLRRLPSFLLRDGLAEAYKSGLIGDPGLVDIIAREGTGSALETVIARALRVKAHLVDADAGETGVRAYLNFGHTIGHALEFSSSLSHGEAVGLGMLSASRIAEKLCGFEHADNVESAIAALGLPVRADGFDIARVMDLLGRDKKRDAGGTRMVLLEDIAKPVIFHVERSDIELGLSAIGL
jgi:3-dehydroquinate synthase